MHDEFLPDELPPFLRVSDLARLYGCHRSTIFRMIERGEHPRPVRISRNVSRWPRAAVLSFLRERGALMSQDAAV